MADSMLARPWVDPTYEAEYDAALMEGENGADRWVAACGGAERPFTYKGTRWLYVWNPARNEHGYLNLDTDMVEATFRTEEVIHHA